MKWIRYYLKAPYPEKRRKKKKIKRNVCMKFLQRRMPVYLKKFLLSSIKDVSHPPCSIVSVTVRATRALANMVVFFLASS